MSIKINLIVNYLLVFILVLLSGSLLQVGYVIPTFAISLIFVICILLSEKSYKTRKLKIFLISFLSITIILIFNFTFSNSKDFGNYLTVILFFLLVLIIRLLLFIRNVQFIDYFNRILKIIIIFSLIGFVFIQFLPSNLVEIGNDGFKTNTIGYVFFYGSNVKFGPLTIIRNQSFFWEPGVLSVYSNLFLFFFFFFFRN